MPPRHWWAALLGSLVIALYPLIANADAIDQAVTIQDTSGFTRASQSVDGSAQIQFDLINATGSAADGATVTLTNAASGETLTAVASNGSAVFEGVGPGTWTVATTTPGVTFTNIAINSTALAIGAGAGIGAGAAALAVGGTTAAIVAYDQSQDDDSGSDVSPAS